MRKAHQKDKRPWGSLRKFKDPETLQGRIDDYFQECNEKDIPLTVSGLAVALDVSRRTILNYKKGSYGKGGYTTMTKKEAQEFSQIIRMAYAMIEAYNERQLFKSSNVSGAIFNLKQNFGWNAKGTKSKPKNKKNQGEVIIVSRRES